MEASLSYWVRRPTPCRVAGHSFGHDLCDRPRQPPLPRGALPSVGLAWLRAPLAPLAVVVDDFDVVAVGVEHVGGVIAGVIARALTGLAVAAISRRGRLGVEAAYDGGFA